MTTETVVPSPSVWSLLVSIIDRPRQTFAAVVEHPRWKWALPLVIAIIGVAVAAIISAPHTAEISELAVKTQLANSGLSGSDLQDALDQSARFRSPGFLAATGAVTGALFLPIGWLLMGGLFYFLSLVIGADELKFGTVFNVVAWATIPLALRNIVQSAAIGLLGKFPVYTGLGALAASGDLTKDAGNWVLAVFSFADIFWLWHFGLLVIGLAVVTKFSRTKAFLLALVYALIAIGFAVGGTFLSGGLG